MNIYRLQGIGLIVGSIIGILFFYRLVDFYIPYFFVLQALVLIEYALFVLGLPAIQAVQHGAGWLGRIGIILMLLPVIDRLAFEMINIFIEEPLLYNQIQSSIWNGLASIGLAYSGYLLTGWLTLREHVFPRWLGWLLLILGAIKTVFWFMLIYASYAISDTILELTWILHVLELAVFAGYGWGILKHKIVINSHQIDKFKEDSRIDELIKILENESDWILRIDAAEALMQLGNEYGFKYLTSALESPNAEIRDVAREILGSSKHSA